MTQFIDDQARGELAPVLATLTRPVRLVMFSQQHACGPCR
jgi:hypothetical protein